MHGKILWPVCMSLLRLTALALALVPCCVSAQAPLGVAVSTTQELRTALENEVTHILVNSPLDFSGEIASGASGAGTSALMTIWPGTLSVRGKCSSPGSASSDPSAGPDACLITTTDNLFRVASPPDRAPGVAAGEGRALLLENLVLSLPINVGSNKGGAPDTCTTMLSLEEDKEAGVWLKGVSFQGDEVSCAQGVQSRASPMYMERGRFNELVTLASSETGGPAIYTLSTVSFSSVNFTRNVAGAASAAVPDGADGVVRLNGLDAKARFVGCGWLANEGVQLAGSDRAAVNVYADDPVSIAVHNYDQDREYRAVTLAAAPNWAFLTGGDSRVRNIENVVDTLFYTPASSVDYGTSASGGGGGSKAGIIAGITIGVVVILAAIGVTIFVVRRRQGKAAAPVVDRGPGPSQDVCKAGVDSMPPGATELAVVAEQ